MANELTPEQSHKLQQYEQQFMAATTKEEAKAALKLSLDLFGGVCLPEVCTAPFAPLHQNIWELLTTSIMENENQFMRFAIGLPRGHAKTQILKMLLVYSIVYSDARFFLVVCNTATAARNFLDDVLDILSSDNIVSVFGDWRFNIDCDNDQMTKFSFNGRKVILKPMGIGSSVRGTNIDNRRPDVIICDDAQDRESAMSPEIARKQLQWFLGTLLKARSPRKCVCIYIGNMYPDVQLNNNTTEKPVYGCILRNLQLSKEWRSWITGAIQADGSALWEEVHPIDSLLSDLQQDSDMGEAEIWYAEVQNDPQAQTNLFFDANKLPEFPYHEHDLVVGKYIMIDPSVGKKKSDRQVVVLFYVYDDLGPIAQDFRVIQSDAPTLVREVLEWAMEERVPLVCAENYAYQATLLQWFVFVCNTLQLEGINFVGINRGTSNASKNSAIISSFKSITNGSIKLHPKNVLPAYSTEARFFNPVKTDNVDDLLDTVAYGLNIYRDYPSEYLIIHDVTGNDRASHDYKQIDFDPSTYDYSGGIDY